MLLIECNNTRHKEFCISDNYQANYKIKKQQMYALETEYSVDFDFWIIRDSGPQYIALKKIYTGVHII